MNTKRLSFFFFFLLNNYFVNHESALEYYEPKLTRSKDLRGSNGKTFGRETKYEKVINYL